MRSLGGSSRNRILAALPARERERMRPDLERVTLRAMEVLYDAEQPIERVYFPETAVVSLLNVVGDGPAIETATVGQEGLVGLPVFHGVMIPSERALVHGDGLAIRMRTSAFTSALDSCAELRRLLHHFAQAQLTLTAQSSACDRRHSVMQRCARWLLLSHDRSSSNEFVLTHLFLSQMLGVRRSSVTVAAEALRSAGAIGYTRGRVTVTDRDRLEELSCECYSIIRSAYNRLLARKPLGTDFELPSTGIEAHLADV